MFEVYEAVADAVADTAFEEAWHRYCSSYRTSLHANASKRGFDDVQQAAMDRRARTALRRRIMNPLSSEMSDGERVVEFTARGAAHPIPDAIPPQAAPSAMVVVPVQSGVPRGLSDPYVPPQEVRPKFPWGLKCKDCRSRVEFYHHQGGFDIRCKSCGISEWYNQTKCECLYKIAPKEPK